MHVSVCVFSEGNIRVLNPSSPSNDLYLGDRTFDTSVMYNCFVRNTSNDIRMHNILNVPAC